jgi:hypothetical protein
MKPKILNRAVRIPSGHPEDFTVACAMESLIVLRKEAVTMSVNRLLDASADS